MDNFILTISAFSSVDIQIIYKELYPENISMLTKFNLRNKFIQTKDGRTKMNVKSDMNNV
jgi:hypothetical protein